MKRGIKKQKKSFQNGSLFNGLCFAHFGTTYFFFLYFYDAVTLRCRSWGFDCLLLVFIRRWGWMVMQNYPRTYFFVSLMKRKIEWHDDANSFPSILKTNWGLRIIRLHIHLNRKKQRNKNINSSGVQKQIWKDTFQLTLTCTSQWRLTSNVFSVFLFTSSLAEESHCKSKSNDGDGQKLTNFFFPLG